MATQLDALFVEIFFKGDQRALDNFKRGWKQLDDGIKNTQQTLDRFAKRFAVIGTVGAAAMGLIGKAGLDTERSLLRTRAELALTEDQMRTLREEALKIGAQLPLNTADIVNAQRAYGKLGATFGEIIGDVPAIAGAAVSTGLQPEQAARYARIVQNVFGGDPQENLDIMVRLASRSQGDFLAFGEALQFSGQSAADAGLDFKTYIATLGGLAGSGRSVESVSQGLAGIWAMLAKSQEGIGRGGKIVQKAFEGVGISMADVNATMDGTADGFVRLLELIDDAGLSPTQRTALLSTLAGTTYASAVSSAVQNTEMIRGLLGEAVLAPGEIGRQMDIIMGGASGGITQMMAQIDTLLNRLAQLGVLTAIETFTRGISKLVSWLTETNEEGELVRGGLLRMMTIMGGLLAALLPLGIALKAVSFALNGLVPLLKIAAWANTKFGISAKFATFWNSNFMVSLRLAAIAAQGLAATIWTSSVAALRALATRLAMASLAMLRFAGRAIVAGIAGVAAFAAAIWTGAVPALAAFAAGVWATTVAMLANPVGLIVLAIVGLIAALVLLVKHWDTVTGALKFAWNWIKGNWPLLVGILLGPFGIVGALVWKFRDQILGAFREVWDWLRESPIFSPVIDGIQAIIDFVRELPGRVLAILKDIPGMVADAIRDIPGLGAALEVFTGIAGKVGKAVFAEGGIVPGPLGRPLLATVHGGEMVLPVGASRVIAQMLKGFQLGPAALPQAPYHYGQMYRSFVTNRTVNINMNEPIVIHTQATDAKGIAQEIGETIQDQIRNVAYDHDGPVER